MKRRLTLSTLLIIAMTLNTFSQAESIRTGIFETFDDINVADLPGSASYDEPSQVYRITGSGHNIWFGEDGFSFLSKPMEGDFIVQTQFRFIGDGHEPHRKTGIMFRKSKSPGSPMVACTVHGDGLTSLQFRRTEGADVEEVKMDIHGPDGAKMDIQDPDVEAVNMDFQGPDVIQMEKKGNTFTMSATHFGSLYQVVSIDDLDLGEELMAGLFVCSHNNEFSEEVEFFNTRAFNTAPDTLVQYRDFLGSYLEIMEVETGRRQVLAEAPGSWQAPNWTPDGKTLIYNSEGKLYNFDLATRESTLLNTGFADNNNNDHVLTFDGKQLGISHHPEEDDYQSVIYTLPVEGGTPKRITKKSPSYLHGWSPDNKYLIYTAERNGVYNIYRIPAEGGKEKKLTDTPGLDDGSEYSPDGKYIYFNSTRTGTMQIWRMEADGSNPVQLTFDALNDWFPHVSPDNKWLVFVSFPEEVPADQHPFYKRVYIRMMPVEGGKPRAIGYLYGGQGTMNVPSWSPDSKKIAFVSNGIFY